MRDLFRVGLGFAGQRLQPSLQVFRRCGVNAVVDLAGVDQPMALASAKIDAVEFVLLQRKAGDRERLALGTDRVRAAGTARH
jgi:hypothetical protein